MLWANGWLYVLGAGLPLPLLWAGCRLPLLLLLPRPYWLYIVQAVHWLSALSLVYVARRSLQGKLALRDIARALQVGQYYHVPEWLQEKLKDHDRAHVKRRQAVAIAARVRCCRIENLSFPEEIQGFWLLKIKVWGVKS